MSGPRLSIIPAGAVTDRSLEPRDLQVLCLLGRHIDKMGWCVRSQVKMAVELDCGRSSVQRSLERLTEAGWIERRRRDGGNDGDQQSAAYAYRVRLDIDDAAAIESGPSEEDNSSSEGTSGAETEVPASYDEAANQAELSTGVPIPGQGVPIPGQGVPTPGQGCPAMDGHGCPPIAGHITSSSEREGERDARARDRTARFIVNFEARWPTAAADDRQRVAYAAEALGEAEQDAALAGIGPFLENLKRLGRKNVPAGWKYLEEKRWTLLEAAKADAQSPLRHLPRDSAEAKAVAAIYRLAGRGSAIFGHMRATDGGLWYRGEITPQLLALAKAPPEAEFVPLDYRQAGAWNGLIDAHVLIDARRHLREGDRAPWPWPPGNDGRIYPGTGPPGGLLSEADEQELANFR